jgi:hypothetical protein
MKILLTPWRRRRRLFELHRPHARDRKAFVAFFPPFFSSFFDFHSGIGMLITAWSAGAMRLSPIHRARRRYPPA